MMTIAVIYCALVIIGFTRRESHTIWIKGNSQVRTSLPHSTCSTWGLSFTTTSSATRSLSLTKTTLSPNDAAISSRVFCFVSLYGSTWVNLRQRSRATGERNSREIEIRQDEEAKWACYKDIVVVLLDVGEGAWSGFGDCKNGRLVFSTSLRTPGNLLATLTTKWEAAAKPMTLLLSATGRTSAPYSHVVLLIMPSVHKKKLC